MRKAIGSLQLRLSIELGLLFLIATSVAVGGLFYRATVAADSLDNRELGLRAEDLARAVTPDVTGAARLDLSSAIVDPYARSDQRAMFAVRDASGRIVAALPPAFGELVVRWPLAADDPEFFRLSSYGPAAHDFHGLSIRLASAAGPVSMTVAQATGGDQLVEALLIDFFNDVSWMILPFAAVTLAVVIWSIRRSLRPLRDASARAASISPSDLSVRLPDAGVPSEVQPLVAAVNRAFERLEQGFALQRRFTADAAHELRTPLAIVTARLDAMTGNGDVAELRTDVQRMNRLVEQLLCVARLDSVALDISQPVDLGKVAAEVVSYMAPLAIRAQRAVALNVPAVSVLVRGNRYAIADALRNLLENALTYTPPQTEVTVTVTPDGGLSVADRGDGIPPDDRPYLFDRFWRGRNRRGGGAGLGLAIVAEIVKSHQATINVGDNQPGGARFDLRFKSLPC